MAIAALAIAVLVAWAGDAAARRRHARGDSGYLWATAAATVGALAVADMVSAMAWAFPQWWDTGRHLEFDRALATWWSFPSALLLPVGLWAAAIAYTSVRPPPHDHVPRWLAGSIGRVGSRWWVLCCGAVPAVALVYGYQRLHQGTSGMSGATWMIAALLVTSLIFLARSGATHPAPAPPAASTADREPSRLVAWPDGMRAQGIALDPLFSWPAGGAPRRVDPAAEDFLERLEAAGAARVAPELAEVVSRLVAAADASTVRAALVLAPDDCGQVESVAHAASEFSLTANAVTLIITPKEDQKLVRRLERWMPDLKAGDVQYLRAGADLVPSHKAAIWIADVQMLSDRLLERLTDPRTAGHIGLAVWWDVHQYTGVMAANVWAISRRFQRLMAARGRPGLKTLVLARDAPHAQAQLQPFVSRMLPYRYAPELSVRVEQGFARPVTLYQLRGHAARFQRPEHQSLPEKSRHPALVATQASASLRWPTCVQPPANLTDTEIQTVFQAALDDHTRVLDLVRVSPADAGARVLHVADADVLALPAIVGQAGRMTDADLPHHVAITTSENPYVTFVLHNVGERGLAPFGSRRLLGAEGHARIVERHLVAALRELPDVGSRLVQTFFLNEPIVVKTLEKLDRAGTLLREEVRFISDTDKDLRRNDYFYRSRHPKERSVHPLDTVGVDLVKVLDPTRGADDTGILQVDPERVTIQAYPGRVFVSEGRRYRIREWTSDDLQRGWLECQTDEERAVTWRIRAARVKDIALKPGKPPVIIEQQPNLSLSRMIVDLTYHETVDGVLRLVRNPTTDARELTPTVTYPPKRSEFKTVALVLAIDPAPSPAVLSCLALALTYVLPVHLGVEHDALEVVELHKPVARQSDQGAMVHGLAIVDLYPNGIGMVDAFQDDPELVRRILVLTRDWLEDERQRGTSPASWPMASATRAEPDLAGAVHLLGSLIGSGTRDAPARAAAGS